MTKPQKPKIRNFVAKNAYKADNSSVYKDKDKHKDCYE
jgi:hypothetical protein